MGRPLSCGRCWACRLEHSRQWAVRCMHEAQLYDENCFITLTYKDAGFSLVPRDFQLFMKKLRFKYRPREIRYYMCGEYGEIFGRPHFHACLFNFRFPDLKYLKKTDSGSMLYTSEILEKLWEHGMCSVGDVTFESAAYVARYCMKKLTGDGFKKSYGIIDPDSGEVFERTKEFARMSLKPGIGARWLEKYKSDVYPHGKVVVNGREVNPPRYYEKLFQKSQFEHDKLFRDGLLRPTGKAAVHKLAAERHDGVIDAVEDNMPHRLVAKDIVGKARLGLLKRSGD